jgi:small-conductance mechanosensitive channel
VRHRIAADHVVPPRRRARRPRHEDTLVKVRKDLALLIWPMALAVASLALSAYHPDLLRALGLQGRGEGLRLVSGAGSYFALAWLAARLAGIGLGRVSSRGRPVPRLLKQLIGTALYAAALIATMMLLLGQGTAGALASSGLLLAFLGFAIRNVVADTLSGIALGLEAPFRIGDWVEIENVARGRVIDIGWRTTRLLTRDSTYMILPNSQIARQRITNYSAPRREYRAQLEITLDHGLPVATARRMLLEVMRNARLILQEPAPDVRVLTYAADGIHYALRYWVPRFDRDIDCRDEIFAGIDEAMRALGIRPPRQRIEIANPWVRDGAEPSGFPPRPEPDWAGRKLADPVQ